jgi:outer membrane cobalamin receptor
VRSELTGEAAWFARVGLSRHFPSLTNRFYSYPGFPGFPGFVGNPELEPERDWTGTAGVEWNTSAVRAGLELYSQFTEGAQVRAPLNATTDTELNLGDARIASLLGQVQVALAGWLELGARFTLSASRIDQTGLTFPGLPAALAVFSAGAHSSAEFEDGGYRWEGRVFERVSGTSAADAVGNRLPAYHEEDLEFRARFGDDGTWAAVARLDDLTDQRPELVRGYPSFGRAFSVLVSRAF